MKNRRGFTLIEVLLAVAILGIGLCVIMELFAGGLRSAKVSEEYTKATLYGKMKMEELLAASDLAEGSLAGSFDDQFSWTAEVRIKNPTFSTPPDPEPTLPIDLYQIVLKVTWSSVRGQKSIEIESLRAFRSAEEQSDKT